MMHMWDEIDTHMVEIYSALHLFIIHDNEGSHCTSRVKLLAPLPASL